MKRYLLFLFFVFFNKLYAQTDYNTILDKIFSGAKIYLRDGKRTMPFAPAEELETITHSLETQIQKYPFLVNRIQKSGVELYINQDLISEVEIDKKRTQALQEYIKKIDVNNATKKDLTELVGYLKSYIEATKKTEKESYRIKTIRKILQMRLADIGLNIPIKKVKVIPITVQDLQDTRDEAIAEIKDEINPAQNQYREDINVNNYKGFNLIRYHFRRMLREIKSAVSTAYVKPNKKDAISNFAIKSPGITASIVSSSIDLSGHPLASLFVGTFTLALNAFHSVFASAILNFHDRLANKSKIYQFVFEFLYTRAIEMTYRMIKYSTGAVDTPIFSKDFGIKVVLNTTVGAWAGALGYRGWNTLVQKGRLTRRQAARFSEGAINFFLMEQLATGFSGDPFWDVVYAISFFVSETIDLGVWAISKILPARTKLIMISVDKNIQNKQDLLNKIRKDLAKEHGVIIEDSFAKINTERGLLKTKLLFLEYNLLLAKGLVKEAISKYRLNESIDYVPSKIPQTEFSSLSAELGQQATLKDILFHKDFGLYSVLEQNVDAILNDPSLFDELFRLPPKLKLLLDRHRQNKTALIDQSLNDVVKKEIDIFSALVLLADSTKPADLTSPNYISADRLKNIADKFRERIRINYTGCTAALNLFNNAL